MLTVEEARAAILAAVRALPSEIVTLDRCAGRVPADWRVTATVDVPPFANSAMDGFAIRAADAPGELRVAGEVAAGAVAARPLEPATALRIMTGAPLPDGADSVVPVEDAEEVGGVVRVPPVEVGAHVRAAGGDTRAGAVFELPAAPLSAAAVAVLASLGVGELQVRRRPRVAVLSTGDELRPPGERLGPGQIHDANTFALAAAVHEAGGVAVELPRARDDEEEIERLLIEAVEEADVVVASGGVSVGRYDRVRSLLERSGTLEFWRIRVQPGKPLAFGTFRGRPVIGLPGNPVSALVTFELFVRPMLRAMLGLPGSGRLVVRAVSRERIAKDRERRAYLRVVVRREGDGYAAMPAGGQGSAQLRPLLAANALLVVPEGEEAAEAGASYDALLIGELDA